MKVSNQAKERNGLFSTIKTFISTTCQHVLLVLHPPIPIIMPAALAPHRHLAAHEHRLQLPGHDPPLVNSDQLPQPLLDLEPPARTVISHCDLSFAKAYLTNSQALNCSGETVIIPGTQNLAVPIHRYSNGGAELDIPAMSQFDPARTGHDKPLDYDRSSGSQSGPTSLTEDQTYNTATQEVQTDNTATWEVQNDKNATRVAQLARKPQLKHNTAITPKGETCISFDKKNGNH